MRTNKISINGLDLFIVHDGFEFVNQLLVKFYGQRLSKKQLITCCEHYINTLSLLGYSDRLKSGFNLKCFKYYELSVYLHGLLSLYCSHLKYSCPPCFGLERFSHLPHDVIKPEKDSVCVEVALLHSPHGIPYYIGFTDQLVFATTFERFKDLANKTPLSRKYNLIFDLK